MLIIKKGLNGIAIIDPKKKFGEAGQYVSYQGNESNLFEEIALAKVASKEVRYYYKKIQTNSGENIPCQIIVTEIPPRHVQPFHTHETLHEISVVDEGSILVIDSNSLGETDTKEILKNGVILHEQDVVIEDPGIRHTVMNHTERYARFTTIQAARIPIEQFPADWKR